MFLQGLNHFQRYAYVRQAHARDTRNKEQAQQLGPLAPHVPRTPYMYSSSGELDWISTGPFFCVEHANSVMLCYVGTVASTNGLELNHPSREHLFVLFAT